MIVTGKGSGGSWQIRGEQLGSAMGAKVIPKASVEECNEADLIYMVKNPCDGIISRRGKAKLIWDIVDHWPQPEGNAWGRDQLVSHVMKTAEIIKADYLIASTEQMANDLGTPYWLRHHGRIYVNQNPVRERVRAVGYEGCPKYLGRWFSIIGRECEKRKWTFVVNPRCLTECDIVVALRDYPHKGYGTDAWKSNVKLQNAQNSGTPIICNREAGYLETKSGGEVFVDTVDEMEKALDYLTMQSARLNAAALMRRQTYCAIDAARDFSKWQLGKY